MRERKYPNCRRCGKSLEGRTPATKFCSVICRQLDGNKKRLIKYRELNPKSLLPPNTVGAISEYRVVADLLTQGYEVFRSCSPSCSCDLAILKDKQLLRVEVTTGHYSLAGVAEYPPHDMDNFDLLAVVLPDRILYYPPFLT